MLRDNLRQAGMLEHLHRRICPERRRLTAPRNSRHRGISSAALVRLVLADADGEDASRTWPSPNSQPF